MYIDYGLQMKIRRKKENITKIKSTKCNHMNTFKLKIKNNQVGARRMAQKVRATAVLPGDQGSIPCT